MPTAPPPRWAGLTDPLCPQCGARVRRTHRCRGRSQLVPPPSGWRHLAAVPDLDDQVVHCDDQMALFELDDQGQGQ